MGLGIAWHPTGALYAVGNVIGSLPGQSASGRVDAFARKYDAANGTILWTRQFGTPDDDWARGVAVDHGGNAYVGGMTAGTMERGHVYRADAFVRAFAPDGQEMWTHRFGTPELDVANDVGIDEGGAYVIVVGNMGGALPAGKSVGGAGRNDAFVVRMTPPPVDASPGGPAPRDHRYFAQTGFRIDDDVIWDYFTHRGGVATFGYPVSRTFLFRGVKVQLFQRRLIEIGPNGEPRQANLLDSELMPYSQINGATLPALDPALVAQAPSPTNAVATLQFVQAKTTNVWRNRSVNFLLSFLTTVSYQDAFPRGGGHPNLLPGLNLEMWGVPTSDPALDPNNHNFVYQRFQRGVMHYDATTQAILLGDYLKAILTGQNLPADLDRSTRASPLRNQYEPGSPRWLWAPELIPGTDLTNAFEPV